MLAVSGGSDSVALLRLWAQSAFAAKTQAHVVSIDHGLRPEGKAECAFVADICEDLGLPHLTKIWSGPYPQTGLQAAARQARHRLLAQAAQNIGAHSILLAHTQDDQAETVWMRSQAGSGLYGFGAIAPLAPSPIFPEGRGLQLVRPLLGLRREALRQYLRSHHQNWRDDPSNHDLRFRRIQARQALAQAADKGRDLVPALATLGDRIAAWDRAGWQAAGRLALRCVTSEGTALTLHTTAYLSAPPPVRHKLLQALSLCLAHRHRAAPWPRVAGLDCQIAQGQLSIATLGGCQFKRQGPNTLITQETGRVSTQYRDQPFDAVRFQTRTELPKGLLETIMDPEQHRKDLPGPGHLPHKPPSVSFENTDEV